MICLMSSHAADGPHISVDPMFSTWKSIPWLFYLLKNSIQFLLLVLDLLFSSFIGVTNVPVKNRSSSNMSRVRAQESRKWISYKMSPFLVVI